MVSNSALCEIVSFRFNTKSAHIGTLSLYIANYKRSSFIMATGIIERVGEKAPMRVHIEHE